MLYYNENEENQLKLLELQTSINQFNSAFEDLNKNNFLIDIDFLMDFLESHDLLSTELKNTIDLFINLNYTKKSDIINYTNMEV